MALRTEFTRSLSITHPIASAPMGGVAGGALAAAVSDAGGLGLVGGGRSDREWLDRELALVTGLTAKPWGIGFLTWALTPDTLVRALECGPAAVMLAFGDPAPFAGRVRAAGVKLIVQVTDLDEARQALDAGADVIVAQGSDAGGHSGRHSVGTMSFVPAVVDLAGPTPVLAAGGIADGRGLAAALMLGAAGALIGTRFQAGDEALVTAQVTGALVGARGSDTERSTVLDIARGAPWPERYPARTLRNAFLDAWRDREAELRGDAEAQREYREAAARDDPAVIPVWASQAVDLIDAVEPAADLVATIAADAERALARPALKPNRSIPASAVIPVLIYPDVREAVAWLGTAFGFVERVRVGDNHRSQLSFGDGAVIIGDVRHDRRPPRPGEVTHSVTVRVTDARAHCERARQHGARILMEPTDFEYGERQYSAEDFAGHQWTFSETLADVAPEEWGGSSVPPA